MTSSCNERGVGNRTVVKILGPLEAELSLDAFAWPVGFGASLLELPPPVGPLLASLPPALVFVDFGYGT